MNLFKKKAESRLIRNKDNAVNFKRFFAAYTIIFAITALAAFAFYTYSGKLFIYHGDGWRQHHTAFTYYGKYLRNIVITLFTEHRLSFPEWSYSIGFGGDILTTLHYYIIGDPLGLLSAIVPAKYALYMYTFLYIFRLYLAGLSFSVFCIYKKKTNTTAIISGGLIYAFCTYCLWLCFRHPFFINPTIYLPLLLIGAEKIIDKKRPYLFIIMVFISCLSNFYFFYMLALVTAAYVIFRLFSIFNKSQLKEALFALIKIGASAVLGVISSAAILLPVISVFLSDTRTGDKYNFGILYDIKYYKAFLTSLTTSSSSMGSSTVIGLSSVALIGVIYLFLKRRKNTGLKIGIILSTVVLALPVFGSILNGFSYIANRWIWAYMMILAYTFVTVFEELFCMEKKDKLIITAMLVLYAVASITLNDTKKIYPYLVVSIVIAFIAMFVFANSDKLFKGEKRLPAFLIVGLVIASILNNAYCTSTLIIGYDRCYTYKQTQDMIHNSSSMEIKRYASDDKSFYRFSSTEPDINSELYDGTKGTSFYWSMQNPCIAQFMEEMQLPCRYLYMYLNLNKRASLNSLASVKYYHTDTSSLAPYGFNEVDKNIYENDNTLPLGYTYDSYITRDYYNSLNAVQKQSAILQGVLLEKDASDYTVCTPTLTEINKDYTVTASDGVTYKDGKITVEKASGAKLKLKFSKTPNSETYLKLKLDDYTNDKLTPDEFSYKITGFSGSDKYTGTKYVFNPKYALRSDNRKDYLFDVAYSKEGLSSIEIKFNTPGVYTVSELSVISQPMDTFSEQIDALKADVMENVYAKDDVISGTIKLDKAKILCLSVPYSKGWTAYVDGEEAEVYQANTMYMALPLSAGEHTVKLVYKTPYLRASMCVSAVGFIGFGFTVFFYEKMLKKRNETLS